MPGILTRQFLTAAFLLLGAVAKAQVAAIPAGHPVVADSASDGDWVAYRDVYREMILFEKYGKPKQFLQNQLRVTPHDRAGVAEGLRLTLVSKSTAMQLPLDSLGRTVFPMSRIAYDEHAELRLNRRTGQFTFEPSLSIAIRANGVYEAIDLRTACEQALAYMHYIGRGGISDKRCKGVQFTYPKDDAEIEVRFRKADQSLVALPAKEGGAFAGDVVVGFKNAVFHFADWPPVGQILTRTTPLAITPLIEN